MRPALEVSLSRGKSLETQGVNALGEGDMSRLCVSLMELYGWVSMWNPIWGSLSAMALLLAAWIVS